MARAKGMLNLSGNIEPLAGAPFDARGVADAKADLTTAGTFDYPYEGMETYVKDQKKKYRYLGGDITDQENWEDCSGTGGGGQTYNDFTGATASTAGAHGLVPAPSAGDEDKVLFGNGAWGALPSVDLSMLSNEAFQLSYNEKPVGTSVSGKLLYSKTLDFGDLPNQTTKSVSLGVANIESVETIFFEVFYSDSGTYLSFPVGYMPTDGGASIYESIEYRNGNVIYMTTADRRGCTAKATVFYTKTTDSPLPAGVKFAGVTSTGEAIFKQTISTTFASGLIYTITDTNVIPFRLQANMRADNKSVMSDGFIYNTNNYWSIWVDDRKIYGINGGTSYAGRTIDIDLYYTLAS